MEAMAVALELSLQLAEVVDLAVRDDLDLAGFVEDGLLAAGQIDDGESAHAEADAGQDNAALFIRSAMVERSHHARELVGDNRPLLITLNNADDATHVNQAIRLSGQRASRLMPDDPALLSPEFLWRLQTREFRRRRPRPLR